MKRPEDILSQPYHIQEYINHLEGELGKAEKSVDSFPSSDCDEACYYHCTKGGQQPPECIASRLSDEQLKRECNEMLYQITGNKIEPHEQCEKQGHPDWQIAMTYFRKLNKVCEKSVDSKSDDISEFVSSTPEIATAYLKWNGYQDEDIDDMVSKGVEEIEKIKAKHDRTDVCHLEQHNAMRAIWGHCLSCRGTEYKSRVYKQKEQTAVCDHKYSNKIGGYTQGCMKCGEVPKAR